MRIFIGCWLFVGWFSALFAVTPGLQRSFLNTVRSDSVVALVSLFDRSGIGVNDIIDETRDYALIHLAAQFNSIKIMRWLIENQADVNLMTGGNPPMIVAARYGHVESMDLLVASGADIGARDRLFQDTVLARAAWNGHNDAVDWLIENGAKIDTSALMWSLREGHDQISNRLASEITDVNSISWQEVSDPGRTLVMQAAMMGNVQVIKKLIARGAKVNTRTLHLGNNAIGLAVEGHLSFVDEPSVGGERSSNSYRLVVKALRDAGADLDNKDYLNREPPLFAAIRNGDHIMVRILIEAGADRNFVNQDGHDALSLAGSLGEYDIVLELAELGIDP